MSNTFARLAGARRLAVCLSVSVCALVPAFAQQTPPPANAPKPPRSLSPARPVPPPPPPVKLPTNIVARVDGKDITRDEVLAVFDMVNGRPIVGQVVQAYVLQNEAKRLGVTVTDAEVNKAVREAEDRVVAQQMQQGGKPMTFNEIAAREGFREDLVRYSVKLDILRRKAFLKSTEAQIPTLGNQIKLEHLLIATIPLGAQEQPTPPAPGEQEKKDADAKVKVEGILADIKAGKITFEEAAKKYSDDKSNAADGGALPWASKGQFDPTFEQAAFAIPKAGDVVGPIKSNYGWHLIKLVGSGKDATAAQKAAYRKEWTDKIAQNSQNPQAIQSWFNGVMEKAKVQVNPAVKLVPNAKSPGGATVAAPAAPAAKKPVQKTAQR